MRRPLYSTLLGFCQGQVNAFLCLKGQVYAHGAKVLINEVLYTYTLFKIHLDILVSESLLHNYIRIRVYTVVYLTQISTPILI